MSPLVGKNEGSKYDLGFDDASGNFIGLMLVKDKNGVPRYSEVNDPALSSQFFTGQLDYANLQPQKELQIGQDDLRSGFGLEYWDSNDTKRYYTSKNVDARYKGMVIAGPLATAATMPTLYTITDGAMEVWAGGLLTNWTKTVGGAITEETTIVHTAGGSSAKYDASGAAQGIWQSVANWSNDFRDSTLTIVAWVYANAATTGRIAIEDDGGTTYSSYHAGNSAWAQLVVTRKLNSAATYAKIWCLNDDASGLAYFDDLTIPTYDTHGKCWEEFDDDIFFSSGKVLLRVANATGTITVQAGMPYTITGLTKFGANLYIHQGTNNYWYMSTAEVLTETDSNKRFATVSSKNLKSVVLPNTVYSATAPTSDAGWDGGTTIGSTSDDITSIVDIRGIPYIGKEDMPYYIDSSGNEQQLIPSLTSERSATSGKNAFAWKDRYYYQAGSQILYEYDPIDNVVTDISPAKYITNSSDFDGQIQAISGDAHWLFVAIDNATKVEIVAGRWETIDGSTRWVWHPLAQLTLTGVETMKASSIYKRRLWVASTASGDSLYYFPLSSQYGNIPSDADYTFQTGGEIITPYIHFNLRGDDKGFIKITLTTDGTSTTKYFEAHYQKLEDATATWVDIGDFGKTATTTIERTEIYLPVDGSSVRPQSEMMRFKFVPITNSTAATPILIDYDIRAVWYPPQKKIVLAQVYVADNLVLRNGQEDEVQTALSIRTAVDAWANPTISWPRKFYPPYWLSSADTIWAKLQPTEGAAFMTQILDERTKNLEWVYNLNLLVISGLS